MSAAGGGEEEAQAEATMHLQGKLCRIMKQYSIIYQNNGFKLREGPGWQSGPEVAKAVTKLSP